jgi:hypothetical protein
MPKSPTASQPENYFFQKHYYKFLVCLMLLGVIMGVASFFIVPISTMGALTLLASKIVFSVTVATGMPALLYRFMMSQSIGLRPTNKKLYHLLNVALAVLVAVMATLACVTFLPTEVMVVSMLAAASSVAGVQVLIGVPFVTAAQLIMQKVLQGVRSEWGSSQNQSAQRKLLTMLSLFGLAVLIVGFGSIVVVPVAPAIASAGMLAVILHQVFVTLLAGLVLPVGIYGVCKRVFNWGIDNRLDDNIHSGNGAQHSVIIHSLHDSVRSPDKTNVSPYSLLTRLWQGRRSVSGKSRRQQQRHRGRGKPGASKPSCCMM